MLDAKGDWVARVLGISVGPINGGGSLVELQKARLAWHSARKQAEAELSAVAQDLRAAVLAHNADEQAPDEYEEDDLNAGIEQLQSTLGALDKSLVDALDDALNAGADDRPGRVAEARAVLGRFRVVVSGNRLLASIDGNAFRPCTIRRDLDAALKTVAAAL